MVMMVMVAPMVAMIVMMDDDSDDSDGNSFGIATLLHSLGTEALPLSGKGRSHPSPQKSAILYYALLVGPGLRSGGPGRPLG